MTTSQFQDPGIFRDLEERIKNPLEPAVGICTETLMDHSTRVKIGGVFILVVFQIVLIIDPGHHFDLLAKRLFPYDDQRILPMFTKKTWETLFEPVHHPQVDFPAKLWTHEPAHKARA